MAKNKGLSKQVQDVLDSKLKIGHSKHQDKLSGITADHIYSWSTYRTYLKHNCYFVKWAKAEHNVKTLEQARPYVDEYLQMRIDQKLSAYTQKLEASALAKLYGCTTEDFIKTETRHREFIVRSRGQKVRDRHFSESRNQEFVDFCRATGLRRDEIKTLTTDQLGFNQESEQYFLKIIGKGGRYRECPILSDQAVQKIKGADGLVWDKIPNGADIHAYRADYCTKIYELHARRLQDTPMSERYYCRGDLVGVCYDKKAMKIASLALGHNRISVIAGHYIRSK